MVLNFINPFLCFKKVLYLITEEEKELIKGCTWQSNFACYKKRLPFEQPFLIIIAFYQYGVAFTGVSVKRSPEESFGVFGFVSISLCG